MANSTNITIVEDDFIITNFIKTALIANGYQVADICNSYDSFIASMRVITPDIVLVDIRIDGDKTGIDVAKYLRDNASIPFVFISSLSDKGTIDAAKQTLPSAYLIKPFEEEDLYAAIEVALMNFAQRQNNNTQPIEGNIVLENAIFIKQKQAFIKVMKADIIYIESKGNYVKIFTLTDDYLIRQPLNEIHQILPIYFYRVHRSFIVNLNCIKQILYEALILTNNITIPLSRSIYADLIESVQVLKT
jgi:DNA-binding LytR/AlgR family response regulator